ADRFGRAAIDVVHDWLYRVAHRRRRVLLLQAMMIDVALGDGLANWSGKIHIRDSEIAGARIVNSRLETRLRQFDERVVLADTDCLGHRSYLSHQWPRFFTRERDRGF